MLKRCDYCLGRKKINGLGMILKDCPLCKGVGFIEESLKVDTERSDPFETADIEKKRRGRPPTITED